MSWDAYVTKLLSSSDLEDAAIVGCEGGVWAAHPEGWLKGITPSEVKVIMGDHSNLFATGVTLGGKKCAVLRYQLAEEPFTLDLKMKVTDTNSHPFFITIARSHKALIIGKGKKDGHGGAVNPHVYNMMKYLRELSF